MKNCKDRDDDVPEKLPIPEKTRQEIASVMFGAASKIPLSPVGSPLTQVLIDIHVRQSQYAIKWVVEKCFRQCTGLSLSCQK